MQFKVEIIFGNPVEAIDVIGALVNVPGLGPLVADAIARQQATSPSEQASGIVDANGAPVESSPAEEGKVEVVAAQPTKEELKAAITKLTEVKKLPAAIEVLAAFNVKRMQDLKPEQYADVIAAAVAAAAS